LNERKPSNNKMIAVTYQTYLFILKKKKKKKKNLCDSIHIVHLESEARASEDCEQSEAAGSFLSMVLNVE
jgi:hypothetical protein